MQLTQEELLKLTDYLSSALKRKKFFVNKNHHGVISYAKKFGIYCCPAICNSKDDGRHGYAYIQLTINSYSEKDLGSYYKPRTNKSTHQIFDKNDSVDKYAGNNVHIDMHNYKQVIDTFVNDLNKDYLRVINKSEDLDLQIYDEGTCRYKALPEPHWEISADNYVLKNDILNCIKNLFREYDHINDLTGLGSRAHTLSLSREEVENEHLSYFDDYVISNCYWVVYEVPTGIIIKPFRPSGVSEDAARFIGLGAGDILEIIEHWVRDHQDRMFPESLVESVVKIKDTGTVFDGMTGTVEKEDNNKVTVMVDFNSEHKVRNVFKKEQVEILEE